jgi:hypothetical protein
MADDPNKTPPPSKPDNLVTLFNSLWADKSDHARYVRDKAREMFPDAPIPPEPAESVVEPVKAELTALQEELKAMREEREADKKAAAEAKVDTDFQAAIAAARAKYSLSDEGFDKMVERMKSTQNYTDAEAAAAWVASMTPAPAAPGPYLGPQAINLFGSKEKDDRYALLHASPADGFLDAEFSDFMKDPDAYIRSTGIQ